MLGKEIGSRLIMSFGMKPDIFSELKKEAMLWKFGLQINVAI